MPQQFHARPVAVEAVQFTGHNRDEIKAFVGEDMPYDGRTSAACFYVWTIEGLLRGCETDWIIRSASGAFTICRNAVFQETYEAAS